ncbi:hypothetical protein Tco_1347040 [Tanacetum coccineum]
MYCPTIEDAPLEESLTSSKKERDDIPSLGMTTPVSSINSDQTMADHIPKSDMMGSSIQEIEKSSSNSKGIDAIVNKLENLGRDMKKLKKNVHVILLACQTCEGGHLDKDCPLNEEVEEVKYGEFN